MAHTPGPWRAEHRHSGAGATDDETGGLGWDIVGPPEPSMRGQFARAADARLVAAAPELLAACKALLAAGPCDACYDDPHHDVVECECPCHTREDEAREMARVVIAKMEGVPG